MTELALNEALGELLEYPGEDVVSTAERCRAALEPRCAEAARAIEAFGNWAASTSHHEREELYARSFDFNPSRCLDLGYQLFGETYKRGMFLLKVQTEVKAHGIAFAPLLADHLAVVLKLLPRLERESAKDLVDEVVLPVLVKILALFGEGENPYRLVLEAVKAQLQSEWGITTIRELPKMNEEVKNPPGMVDARPPPANRWDEVGGIAP